MESDNLLDRIYLPLPQKETFANADPRTQMMYLFDLQCKGLENQKVILTELQKRQAQDSSRQKRQSEIAGIFGLLGGFATVLVAKIFKL